MQNETLANASSALIPSVNTTTTIVQSGISKMDILIGVYLTGVVLFLVFLMYKIIRLSALIIKGEKTIENELQIVQTSHDFGVCSFLKYIIISKDHTTNSFELAHEQSHIKQYHSIDLLIAMLYQSIFWFNPVSYLYVLNLKEVHEFLADRGAIQVLGKSDYQNHIITVLSQKLQPKLVHNFNSIIKTRLTMMNSNTKPSLGAYLSTLFVLCIMLFLFSCHAKKVARYTMTSNGPVKVQSEMVTDTIVVIDADTFVETVSYVKREVFYISDTTIVIDYDTFEESISIVKSYLEPQDFMKIKK